MVSPHEHSRPADARGRDVAACWSCGGPVAAGALFCPTCEAVQPPGQIDHFARLGLTRRFDLDPGELDRAYFARQCRLHPDRFALRSPRERALSQQQATCLNEAYEVLRDPLRRADYLVHLKGSGVLTEGCNLVADQDLLTETMELREALAEAESGEQVATLAGRAAADIEACIAALSRAFADDDLGAACRLTTRLKYLRKLAEQCRARRVQMAALERS